MKKYIIPQIEISSFMMENVVMASGTNGFIQPLTDWKGSDTNKSLVEISLEDMQVIM